MKFLEKVSKTQLIFSTAVIIITFCAAVFNSPLRPVTAGEFYQLEQRTDNFITYDRLDNLRKRKWTLELEYKDKVCPPGVQEEIHELDKEIEYWKDYLKKKE